MQSTQPDKNHTLTKKRLDIRRGFAKSFINEIESAIDVCIVKKGEDSEETQNAATLSHLSCHLDD